MAKDKAFYQKKSLNIGGGLLSLEEPLIMGILNINPDSFYDGGAYMAVDQALKQARKMQLEGADIIDIGPASSKPGSSLIEPKDEWKLVAPVLKALKAEMPEMTISLDSYNASTAEKALENGVHIINDISGGRIDPNMIPLIGATKAPYILMHMQGLPESMQKQPRYANVVKEVAHFFSEQLEALLAAGAHDLILDPGFGFGKALNHNYILFNHIAYFRKVFDLPILVGISRKSMVYKPLAASAAEALNGTTVLNTLALQQGANILRVHDVREAVEARKILKLTQNSD